jgi:hypothetical protein
MFLLPSSKSSYLRLEGFDRPAVEPVELPDPVLVRQAGAGDVARIRVLARLDDQRLPAGPYLVADLAGEIVAAISLASGCVVADPFRRTADAAEMLRLRAAQLAERERVAAPNGRAELNPAAA